MKDDTRRHILSAAKRLFLSRGFSKTPMRDIAAEAGVGVGNIYHYFDSKDHLLRTIVSPVTSEMERMLTEHHGRCSADVVQMFTEVFLRRTVGEYISLIKTNRSLMTILLFRSQGSSLERFRDDFTDRVTAVVREWFAEVSRRHPEVRADVSDFTIHLHTVWEFALFEEIIMHRVSDAEIDRVVGEYVRFEIHGWRKMLDLKYEDSR